MKKPDDPYGISLLDVLTNALAAAILLFLIVSVGSKSQDSEKNDDADSFGGGKVFSDQKAKIGEAKDTIAYTIEIDAYNGKPEITINDTISWELSLFDGDSISTQTNIKQTFLIKQKIKMTNDNLSLLIITFPEISNCDSISVFVFNGNIPKTSGITNFFKPKKNGIINLNESGQLSIFGTPQQ